MDFDIRHNLHDVRRGLSGFQRQQLPFALSLMLNWIADDIRKNSTKQLKRRLDRPTKFTERAYSVWKATKRTLKATVFAKRIQGAYLKYAEEGGARDPKKKAIVIPVRQRVNKHGNLPRKAIQRALARPDTFSGRPKGRPNAGGIYRRTRQGLRLMVDYASRALYRPRLFFKRDAQRTAEARANHHFTRAMQRAIETARR